MKKSTFSKILKGEINGYSKKITNFLKMTDEPNMGAILDSKYMENTLPPGVF